MSPRSLIIFYELVLATSAGHRKTCKQVFFLVDILGKGHMTIILAVLLPYLLVQILSTISTSILSFFMVIFYLLVSYGSMIFLFPVSRERVVYYPVSMELIPTCNMCIHILTGYISILIPFFVKILSMGSDGIIDLVCHLNISLFSSKILP